MRCPYIGFISELFLYNLHGCPRFEHWSACLSWLSERFEIGCIFYMNVRSFNIVSMDGQYLNIGMCVLHGCQNYKDRNFYMDV